MDKLDNPNDDFRNFLMDFEIKCGEGNYKKDFYIIQF